MSGCRMSKIRVTSTEMAKEELEKAGTLEDTVEKKTRQVVATITTQQGIDQTFYAFPPVNLLPRLNAYTTKAQE